MRENQFAIIGKMAIVTLLVLIAASAFSHISHKQVPHPLAFVVTLVGFVLFLSAKLSLIRRGVFLSFGKKHMTQRAANLYRLGYWLMIVGILFTFA